MTERFVIGLVGAPFGLKGFVKVRPLSGEVDHLLKLRSLTIRREGREEERKIEESAPLPSALLIKFAGIDSPEDAKTLRGAELLADREHASPLGPGEFYVEDLRGLAVIAGDAPGEGAVLGRITGIVEGGGGDLAEITLSGGETRLVPFRREFFPEIDPEKGRVALVNRWILE
ncbi:MAG: ribosome maturation factor RimM [Treponema sp.]|jgi:16S rRNA processing protein RimM|nr:ribosome maturation factor RimM [Treponema sp.]